MIDTPQSAQPELPPVHEAALNKLSMIAGEYFEDYLIVVSRGKERFVAYKNEDDAHGKASFVLSNINQKWWKDGSRELK